MDFENPSLSQKSKENKSFGFEEALGKEGEALKGAGSRFAKVASMAFLALTLIAAAEVGMPNKAEARGRHRMTPSISQLFEKGMGSLRNAIGIDKDLERNRVISQGVRRAEAEKERAHHGAGRAEFARRLNAGENLYVPLAKTVKSGVLNPDFRDEYYQSLDNYERQQEMERREAEREAGRAEGKEWLEEQGY